MCVCRSQAVNGDLKPGAFIKQMLLGEVLHLLKWFAIC